MKTFALVFFTLFSLPGLVKAQSQSGDFFKTSAPEAARYQVVQLGSTSKRQFLFDRYSGRIWIYVRTDDGWKWRPMRVDNRPQAQDQEVNYQILWSNEPAGIFLINIDSGVTWRLTTRDNELLWEAIGSTTGS